MDSEFADLEGYRDFIAPQLMDELSGTHSIGLVQNAASPKTSHTGGRLPMDSCAELASDEAADELRGAAQVRNVIGGAA